MIVYNSSRKFIRLRRSPLEEDMYTVERQVNSEKTSRRNAPTPRPAGGRTTVRVALANNRSIL